jgi:hypothetical protein
MSERLGSVWCQIALSLVAVIAMSERLGSVWCQIALSLVAVIAHASGL